MDDEIDVWKFSTMIRQKNHKMQHKYPNSKKVWVGGYPWFFSIKSVALVP